MKIIQVASTLDSSTRRPSRSPMSPSVVLETPLSSWILNALFGGGPRFGGADSFSVRQISGLEYKFGNPSAKVASGKKPAALDPMRTIQMKLNLVLAN